MLKKKVFLVCIILIICTYNGYSKKKKIKLKSIKVDKFPFIIYKNAGYIHNHYSPSGWMGDCGDLSLIDGWKKRPKSKPSCIKITYSSEKVQYQGWAGIYWQNPTFNWGYYKDLYSGYDLSKAKKLFFWACGKKGGEVVGFKMGGITGDYPDSTIGNPTKWITLKKYWQLYEIDLSVLNLTYIIGGFCVLFSSGTSPDGCVIYLDDIYYYNKKIPHRYVTTFKNMNIKDMPKPDDKLKIAVMEFRNITKSKEIDYLTTTISEEMAIYLNKKDNIWVIDCNKMNNHIKNLSEKFDNNGKLNTESFVSELLEVDVLIKGYFIEKDDKINIYCKAIKRKTGKIIAFKQVKGDLGKDMFLLLENLSQSIYRKISKFLKKNR